MILRCFNWLKFKLKQHYVFLHVPTGLYIKQKPTLIWPAGGVEYELSHTPSVFYSSFGRTKNLKKFLRRILKNAVYISAGNFSYLHTDVDPNEFELVRYYGKV